MDSSPVVLTKKAEERFFPVAKGTEKFDTTIFDKNIQISIAKVDLDSYVVNEYETDKGKQTDKYRDAEIRLTVKQNSQLVVDTVFKKQQFSSHAEDGFMNVAIFQGYWINGLTGDSLELLGTICRPETDWCLDFKHYFNLTTRKFEVVVQEDAE